MRALGAFDPSSNLGSLTFKKMVILIPKIPKNPKSKTNSKQLEIWERIENQKKKESRLLEIRKIQTEKKNKESKAKIGHALEKIYANIYDLEKSIPRNIDPRNQYLNKKALSIRSEIKSLKLGLQVLAEYRNLVENTSLLAKDLSRELLIFSKKLNSDSPSIVYIKKIAEFNKDLQTNPTEYHQKAESLIKLTSNIIQLRKSLSKSIKGRTELKNFDSIIQKVLENKVPF